ncbi:hypothetical protein [Helicobacter fennelliae]|uniref:hypothetical protein n=1 Tax=Helicobacter fennelliae TaxID=215 RepID=UPI000DFA3F5F|nr:hypothetical protein [Helicobacter fennelliae]STQ91998.1 Uncharacterised protein [Helicobacter fennelliae]
MFETTENLEYKKEALKIILVSEGFKKLPYNDKAKKDGSGYLTIGYGINLQVRDWLIAVLNELGIFGDITTLDSVADIRALDNTDNKAMIDNFYGITKKIVTDDTISATQTQLNTLLRKHKGVNSGNFEITKEQGLNIKEIVSETIFNGVATVNDKTLKINKETNEYAGILSYAFNVGLQSQEYLFRECNKDNNSRFLSFFTLRYGVNFLLNNDNAKFGIAKRRFWESQLFGFEYNGNNAFKTAIGIFKILNFKYKPRFILKNYNDNFIKNFKESLNQTYLDWIVNYEDKLLYAKKDKNQTWQEFYNADAKTNNLTENFSNIQGITPDKDNILSPYLDYLNTLTQKTFSLENIYCIQSFYGNLGAKKLTNVASINKILSQRFSNNSKQPQPTTQDSTAQANLAQSTNENPTQILILYPKATPLPIQIIQPENTFLTLVVGKNAKLDCSKLLLDKCEIHYLQYDENQEESTENPKITALKTDSELTLTTKDSNLYEVIHNGIIYYISKNEGVLRVALGQNREEVIELYNFAKENKYKILKESHSQILDIQLKLQDNKELPTSHNGNFALTINNLTLLDKNGKNLDIAEDYTLYLHNCENRIIYENTSIQKNTDDTYRVNFSFDLIQDEDSNFFKRTTKLIIATQNLSNDFSTSEIHTKGNVAVVSLSSADKKGGNYTFTKKVSAQEFGEEIKTIYIDNDNPKAYQEQIDDSKKKLNIINIKAYSDKEQTNEIDTCDSETTIFVRAILNEEDRVFYDETIHWAYYIKGASEDLNKIDRDKIKQMENIEGNDIIFSLDMLAEDDKEILLKSLQNNSQKYELILFAYFKKPAIKVGNNITSIVLSMKTSQSMSSPTSPFTLNIKDYLCLTSP